MKKDYFDSIEDLPIWNWWKLEETGNFSYLLKSDNYEEEFEGYEVWLKINDEYFALYGKSDDLVKLLRLQQQLIAKRAEYICDGVRFALTEIDMIEADISEIKNKPVGMSNDESIIYLEEKLGRQINPREMSVKKYYDSIKYYSKK